MSNHSRLHQAILETFEPGDLEQALKFGSPSRDLVTLVTPTAPFDHQVFQLIVRAEKAGWIEDLIVCVRDAKRENQEFLNATADILSAVNTTGKLDGKLSQLISRPLWSVLGRDRWNTRVAMSTGLILLVVAIGIPIYAYSNVRFVNTFPYVEFADRSSPQSCRLLATIQTLNGIPAGVTIAYLEAVGAAVQAFTVSPAGQSALDIENASAAPWQLNIIWSDGVRSEVGPYAGCPTNVQDRSADGRASVVLRPR